MPEFAVIIPAAGQSRRFGGDRGKLIVSLENKPVMRHSLAAFARRRDVRHIIVAVPPGNTELRKMIPHSSTLTLCDGGDNRAESVLNALRRVPADIEWVAVHDAARPLISDILIDRTLAAAVEHGAAVPALPVAQTIKRAEGNLPARAIETVPRQGLFLMQTPQIMRRSDLLDAYAACKVPLEQITDDAQLLELAGKNVWLVEGEPSNLKITTPFDLLMAQTLWARRRE